MTYYRECRRCGQGFQAEAEHTDGDDSGMLLIETICKQCQKEMEDAEEAEDDTAPGRRA